MSRKVLQQALEAMQAGIVVGKPLPIATWDAIQAIRAELAKPVSEPERKPMADAQIDAAIEAWFSSDIVAGPRPFSKRMQAALDAATKDKP